MDANDSPFDPTTLSQDDPLRDSSVQDWIEKVKQDHPEIAGLLASDPAKAVQALADKGVPPPAMSFADPYGNNIDPTTGVPTAITNTTLPPQNPTAPDTSPVRVPGQKWEGGVPPTSIFGRLGSALGVGSKAGSPDPTAAQGPFRIDSGAAPDSTAPIGPPAPAASVMPPAVAAAVPALDPEENPNPVAAGSVPTPTPRPVDTDISAKKKPKADDGSGDFAKMIAALKPVPPPALNPVGTPSVRSPQAAGAPNLSQLLQVLGAQSAPSPVNTLGRLLVAGKA